MNCNDSQIKINVFIDVSTQSILIVESKTRANHHGNDNLMQSWEGLEVVWDQAAWSSYRRGHSRFQLKILYHRIGPHLLEAGWAFSAPKPILEFKLQCLCQCELQRQLQIQIERQRQLRLQLNTQQRVQSMKYGTNTNTTVSYNMEIEILGKVFRSYIFCISVKLTQLQ